MGNFFTIMIVLIVFVVGGFAVLIAFVLKKAKDGKSDTFLETERKHMENAVSEKRSTLSTAEDAYKRISDAMIFTEESAVTHQKLTGTIFTTARQPLVAFQRIERGFYAKGHIVAMTKDAYFYYEYTGYEVLIHYNDIFFGTIDKSGILRNSEGKEIGKALHPDALKGKRSHERPKDKTYPLMMNNQTVATVHLVQHYEDFPQQETIEGVFDTLNFGKPILKIYESPSEETEKWLLAIAIFQTTFHGR